MPLMDEFKEERAEIKNRSFKEKMKYFWDYYKWHVIGGAIGVGVVISLIYTYATKKNTAYYSAFVNMGETIYSEDYKKGFAERTGIDLEKNDVIFDVMYFDLSSMDQSTIATTQKIMVYVSAGDLDSMVGDLSAMDRYAYNAVLIDLREFLTEEEFQKYEPYFYYMDLTLLEKADEAGHEEVTYPEDPMDPGSMDNPIPVGIRLENCPKFSQAYLYGDNQYFAVFANSGNMELNHAFLSYVTEN